MVKLLDRMNSADSSLATQQGVLKRLEMMAKGDPLGELPSCNLWIRTGFKACIQIWIVLKIIG